MPNVLDALRLLGNHAQLYTILTLGEPLIVCGTTK